MIRQVVDLVARDCPEHFEQQWQQEPADGREAAQKMFKQWPK
jgi:hypothetical protein